MLESGSFGRAQAFSGAVAAKLDFRHVRKLYGGAPLLPLKLSASCRADAMPSFPVGSRDRAGHLGHPGAMKRASSILPVSRRFPRFGLFRSISISFPSDAIRCIIAERTPSNFVWPAQGGPKMDVGLWLDIAEVLLLVLLLAICLVQKRTIGRLQEILAMQAALVNGISNQVNNLEVTAIRRVAGGKRGKAEI
jgi:hypothetical protein